MVLAVRLTMTNGVSHHFGAQHYQQDWIGLCSVLRPCQHSIGYLGDGFYRAKDPTIDRRPIH